MAGHALPASAESSDCILGKPNLEDPIETRGEKCFVDGDILFVRGIIGSQTLSAFRNHPIRKINLNSPGGSTTIAEVFAREVRQLGVHTEVSQGSICYSSCTLVFQAGVKRTAHRQAQFLYHCIGLGPFMTQAIQQQCGMNHNEYQGKCASDLEDLIVITKKSTAEYFENYPTYDGQGLHERLMAEPDLVDWFESGNFCKKRLVISAEETMPHDVVQELIADE